MERLNADPQPDSKPEPPAAAAKGQNKPVTALMAFLQEQHARKKHGAAIAARSRKDRGKDSRTVPVRLADPASASPVHMAGHDNSQDVMSGLRACMQEESAAATLRSLQTGTERAVGCCKDSYSIVRWISWHAISPVGAGEVYVSCLTAYCLSSRQTAIVKPFAQGHQHKRKKSRSDNAHER